MTKEELIAILRRLPNGAEVFIRSGSDNAYPPVITAFHTRTGVSAYIGIDTTQLDGHVNYPAGYSGCVEVKL